ncbi:hypothetical protein KKG57_02455 [Patescibacteria group bacterium]|nr:hypothetical protein [Patescibacteria group bacterium]
MELSVDLLNLQSGIGVTRGYRQYATRGMRYIIPHSSKPLVHAGTFLNGSHCDIALLTEVDGGSRRSKYISQLDTLKESTSFTDGYFFPTRSLGNSINEGNGILSLNPLERNRTHPLPSATNPRVLGESRITIKGIPITLFVAHLALRTETRSLQIKRIGEILSSTSTPILLGGDFNERDAKKFRLLTNIGLSFITAPGYPSWKPIHSLQVLFYSSHFEAHNAFTNKDTLFSDHLPLHIDLTFTA